MKDFYTTDDVTDLIHELTLALWDWEKRASEQEADHMNVRLGLLRAYAIIEDPNLKAMCISASNESSSLAEAARIKISGL